MSEASPLDRYVSRDALVYYLLVLPALVFAAVFSLAIATTPGALVAQAGAYGGLASSVADALPFLVLVASIYSVFAFRPAVLVVLLIATFFVSVSVANGIFVAGVQLDLGDAVVVVISSTFLALSGFNYARGLKLAAGRIPVVAASGPRGYNLVGLTLDAAVPLFTALGLVLLVEAVVSAITVQTALLPSPLSTLASLYLQTRIGLVSAAIFVAGGAIWAMRQFIEPIILHFTLSPADAKRELLYEIEPTTKSVRRVSRYRPSPGVAWAVIVVAYCGGLFVALSLFLPRGEFFRDLAASLTLKPPPATPTEELLETAFQNGIVKANILFAQSQASLRDLIRLLWG